MRDLIKEGRSYRSQAIFAQAYVLPISSSAFRFAILLRDCASKELASSMSSGGRGPERRGMISPRAFSTGLLMLLYERYRPQRSQSVGKKQIVNSRWLVC